MQKFKPYSNSEINPKIYEKVFSGCINELKSLEDVYEKFNIDMPKSYYGHSLSVSDIVEVIDSDSVNNGFYYCDSIGFKKVDNFDSSLCESNDDVYKIVAVEPHKPPYETEIKRDIKSLQMMVGGGLIENIYNNDGTIFVINDEGKINGMEGNRRIENDIIAGPFFIIRDDGDDFCSLNDEDISKYMKVFETPDNDITQDEIDSLVGYNVIGFDNTDDFLKFLEGIN
jgi:hypothetical protein